MQLARLDATELILEVRLEALGLERGSDALSAQGLSLMAFAMTVSRALCFFARYSSKTPLLAQGPKTMLVKQSARELVQGLPA